MIDSRLETQDSGHETRDSPPSPQQMFNYHLIQRLVIPVRDQLALCFLIKASHFFHQQKKGSTAVLQVRQPMRRFGGAERVNIKANIFPVATVSIALQNPDLVEGAPQIVAAKRFVLVEF